MEVETLKTQSIAIYMITSSEATLRFSCASLEFVQGTQAFHRLILALLSTTALKFYTKICNGAFAGHNAKHLNPFTTTALIIVVCLMITIILRSVALNPFGEYMGFITRKNVMRNSWLEHPVW
jgi:hypothetical protein